MSIYTALSFDLPLIAYSALHQVRKGVPEQEYIATMMVLHQLVREQSKNVQEEFEAQRSAIIDRTARSLRARMTPFLATPLKSDEDEIQRHFSEALRQVTEHLGASDRLGVITTAEGKVIWEDHSHVVAKKLSSSGKKYLADLHFDLRKPRREIFESMFIVEGGLNLDVIEHLVRDRIGIYTPVHGKHIKEFDSYAYAAHNLVFHSGEMSYSEPMFETALFASKGGTRYAPFRNGVVEVLNTIDDRLHPYYISFWQRKLGLGVGAEFVVRIRFRDLQLLTELIGIIAAEQKKSFVQEAFLNSGSLVLKELIPIAS